MRQYRARKYGNFDTKQEYLERERQRYKKRKEEGKIKTIHNLPEREQRALRRKWKTCKRQQRAKRTTETSNELTPPQSPEGPVQDHVVQAVSNQEKRGRKKVRRDQKKAYRTIAMQKETITGLESKVKFLQRKIDKMKMTVDKPDSEAGSEAPSASLYYSPATKADTSTEKGMFGTSEKRTYLWILSE